MTNHHNNICKLHALTYIKSGAISGGDINQSFQIETKQGLFFLKLNYASRYPKMFQKEAEGLQALQNASNLKVPSVVGVGEYDSQQYLLMEWMERGEPHSTFWKDFAEGLAQQHRRTNDQFGWLSNNYIGSLEQGNSRADTWADFYAHHRIIPLVSKLFDNGSFAKREVEAAEKLCNKFPKIFPDEPPALLHGDLWSGNYMAAKSGMNDRSITIPSIFDPAVYFGHREMDIGMSLLFGGFPTRFYDAYNSVFPLEQNWRNRVPLTQLYPLLVHAVLFGGGYINQSRNILTQ